MWHVNYNSLELNNTFWSVSTKSRNITSLRLFVKNTMSPQWIEVNTNVAKEKSYKLIIWNKLTFVNTEPCSEKKTHVRKLSNCLRLYKSLNSMLF